jgi:hypothetical protein
VVVVLTVQTKEILLGIHEKQRSALTGLIRVSFNGNVINVTALVNGYPKFTDNSIYCFHALLMEMDHGLVESFEVFHKITNHMFQHLSYKIICL